MNGFGNKCLFRQSNQCYGFDGYAFSDLFCACVVTSLPAILHFQQHCWVHEQMVHHANYCLMAAVILIAIHGCACTWPILHMLFIDGLEVAILGVKPDACTKRRMWNLSDLKVSGPGSCSLAALEAGPTCCANRVPDISGTVMQQVALW